MTDFFCCLLVFLSGYLLMSLFNFLAVLLFPYLLITAVLLWAVCRRFCIYWVTQKLPQHIMQITQPSQYGYANLQYRFAVISGTPSMMGPKKGSGIFSTFSVRPPDRDRDEHPDGSYPLQREPDHKV